MNDIEKKQKDKQTINRREFISTIPILCCLPQVLLGMDTKSRTVSEGDGKNIPSPEIQKLLLTVPEPILPSRPDLIEMYRKCWEIGWRKTERGTNKNGFTDWYIDAAFDNRIFQWDTCFSIAWAKYSQGALPNIVSLDNFYRKQYPDGAISGVICKTDGTDDQPKDSPWFTRNNLFSWIEYEYYMTTGDSSRLERVLPILVRYADWVRVNRRHANGHYFWSGWSSGMDNSPRSVADQFYPPYSWVDYDANEALAAFYIAKIAEVVGDQKTQKEFEQRHSELKILVNREMWCEKDGFYWDLDRDGTFLKKKTVASFWPLWARISDRNQVEKLVEHLNDSKSFARPHRVPTLAANEKHYAPEGQYWLGSVWAPTNHMIVKGLEVSGEGTLAREIVVNHLNNMAIVFQATKTVWENYSPEFPKPGKPWAKSDFVGWSAVGPIAQLIEFYIGIKINVPDKELHWDLLTTEGVGIRNLRVGDGKYLDLFVEERNSLSDTIFIITKSTCMCKLIVNTGTRVFNAEIPVGEKRITFS